MNYLAYCHSDKWSKLSDILYTASAYFYIHSLSLLIAIVLNFSEPALIGVHLSPPLLHLMAKLRMVLLKFGRTFGKCHDHSVDSAVNHTHGD